jgi:hypothetical protein
MLHTTKSQKYRGYVIAGLALATTMLATAFEHALTHVHAYI